MPLSIPQKTISDSTSRFRVAVCGRRFGKTHLAMHEIAKVARFPDKNIYAVYPSYRQAKAVLWEPFKKRLKDINWASKINETDLSILLRNGSKISLRGADNSDSLRGVGLDAVVLDEFQLVEEAAWTEVLRPALSDKQGTALFIGTPYGTANWAYDLFQRGKDASELAWESFSYTTIDGGNVPQEEIDQAMLDLDVRTFRQEYLASFESYANRCFYAFEREKNVVPFVLPTPQQIYIGMDFNINPVSAAVFAQNGNTIHQFDEILLHSSNTDEMVAEIKTRYPSQRITVFPDPAGNQRKTSAGGKTDNAILANAGFQVKVPHAHNPIRDGLNAVNSKLCNAKGERSYLIDPKCKKSIESMEKYSFKENSSQPEKDGKYDHMADAIRYYIDYVFPVRREVKQQAPERFGVAVSR